MARNLKRFLVSSVLSERASSVILNREETHHLKNVLRLKAGALCLLSDKEGHEFISRLERFLPDERSEAVLLEPVLDLSEKKLSLSVAQAIPQDRKMDEIVRHAAELGVDELIPLITERTVARATAEKSKKVLERWRKIAEQSIKQSRVSRPPQITNVTLFDTICSRFLDFDHVFILDPSEGSTPINQCVAGKGGLEKFLLLVGPEGGFSADETEQAEDAGAKKIKMGRGILKTDTAFVAAASFFMLSHS